MRITGVDLDGRRMDVVAPVTCTGEIAVHKVASTSHDHSASCVSARLGNDLGLPDARHHGRHQCAAPMRSRADRSDHNGRIL